MLEDEDVVCVSWVDWDGLPIIMHQMMTRLSRRNRILFVDPLFALSSLLAHPRSTRSILGKVRRWVRGVREIGPHLHVFQPSPVLVTPGHSRLNDRLNRWAIGAAIARVARKLAFSHPILWVYDPYAIAPPTALGEKLLCYDCSDEIETFARFGYKRRRLRAVEEQLTRRADVVFATSRRLFEKRAAQNGNTHHLPSGVDFDLFNRACAADCPAPAEIAGLPRPVIGYHGMIANHRIEWDWIRALSAERQDASTVLIGPLGHDAPPADVRDLRNVHFLGPRPAQALPGYLRAFSVGIIPYKGREFLQACQPTKTFEYLAAGKLVVSSLIPELQAFPRVVKVSANRAEFVRNVNQAIAEGRDPERRAECVETARGKTWDARVEETSRLIREALRAGASRTDPPEEAVGAPKGERSR